MKFEFGMGGFKPKTSLLDRAMNNLSDIAGGFVPGMMEIGHSVGNDMWSALPGTKNNFKTPALAKGIGNAIWSQSALPPLLMGNPGEALSRANARPIDALLDLSLAVPATTGLAKAGVRAGIGTEAALPILGFQKAGPDASLVVDAFKNLENSKAPASFTMADGTVRPTREFASLDAFETVGDDIWARPTARSMSPGALPKILNPSGKADEVSGMLQAIGDQQPNLDSLTLGEDLLRQNVSTRSPHEPYALLGDAFTKLTSRIPDGVPFSHSSRLGKNIAMKNVQAGRLAGDVAEGEFQKKLKAVQEKYLELNPDADPETIEKMLDDRRLKEAVLADPEKWGSLTKHLDPSLDLDQLDLEVLRGKTLQQLFDDHGIYIHNKEDWNRFRPDADSEKDLFFGKVLDDFAEAIRRTDDDGNFTSPIEIRKVPEYHRMAKQELLADRAAAEGSLPGIIQNARAAGHHIELIDRKGDNRIVVELDERGMIPQAQFEAMLRPQDYDVKFVESGIPMRHPESGNVPDVDTVTASLNDFLRELRSKAFASHSKWKNFEDLSQFKLNQYRMYGDNAGIFARPDSKTLPIVERLREIEQNAAGDDLWNLPETQELIKFVRDKNKSIAQMKRDVFGEDLFNDSVQEANEKRFAQFARGRDINKTADDIEGEGDFIKMQAPFKEQGDVYKKGRDEFDAMDRFRNSTPGDPFSVFLKGDFDGSMRSVIEDFRQNANYTAGFKTWESLAQHAIVLTPEEYEKVRGKVIDDVQVVDGKSQAGPYVRITDDGPLAAGIQKIRQDIRDLRHRVGDEHSGLAHAAAQMEQFLDGQSIDVSKQQVAGEMHDPAARAAMRTGEVEPEIRVLRTEVYRNALNEVKLSQKALNALLEAPTEIWKYSVLHMRFLSWMRNNLIGAHLMVGMGGGPAAYARELERLMNPEFADARKSVKAAMPDVFGSGSSAQARELTRSPEGSKRRWIEEKITEPLTEINTTVADDPARMMAVFDQMEKQLQYTNRLRGTEGPLDLDPDTVQRFMEDDVLRGELARRTKTQMVDFSNMSDFEKRYIRAIFPFYAWMKGSNIAGFRAMVDSPERLWAAGQVSELGTQQTDEDFGNFSPEFVGTWWNPGGSDGAVLKTSGMNPYTGIVDTLGMGASLVPNIPLPGTDDELRLGMSYRAFGSENPLSSMHPILGAGAESLTGKNVFFGTPIEQGSTGGGFVNKLIGGLPGSMYLNRMLTNETGPDATTRYSRSLDTANFLAGLPIAQPMPGNVRARGVDEMNERYQSPLAWRELR